MNGESLLNVLQQKLLSHPDYSQLAHKLKCDVQTHPTRDEQRTILSALSRYDKENKLITTVQQCLLSLGQPHINSAASEVLVALIKKDKSTVFVLHQFLNQPLPNSLRVPLWITIFGNESVGAAYMDASRDKPYSTLSPQESIIKEKVKDCIRSATGYSGSEFLHSTTGHNLMLKSLSYWHIHVSRPLTDSDYKLCVPAVAMRWKDDSPTSVKCVISLLSGLANLLQKLKASDVTTLNIVLQYVQLAKPDLSEHIMLLRTDLPAAGAQTSAIAQLVAPLHDKLFVGYLSQEVIHFLLDQCVIGNDVSSFNPLFSFTATILCLMSSALSQCNNVSSALSHIEQRGSGITVKQIQHFVQTHYLDSLATQLSTKPTRVHFNTKPTTLGEEPEKDSADSRRLLKELEELRKKLAEEKKQRNDKHIAHRNEMGTLRAENEDLRRRLKAMPAVVPAAAVAPPPVEAPPPPQPETPPLEEEEEDEEDDGDISEPLTAPLRQKQVQTLWLDVARNVMQRVKRLAFKNPARKQELDSLSFYLNKQYEEDRAAAEVELFSAMIPNEEWEAMSEEEYYDKIYQIDCVVEKYARERYAAQTAAQTATKKKKK